MIQRTGSLLGILILGVFIAVTLQSYRTQAQTSAFTFTPLARVGDVAPGNAPFRFSQLGGARINNQGDVLFGSGGSLYLQRQGQLRRIAQLGDPTPLGATIFYTYGSALNDQGDVVFTAELSDGRWAIFRVRDGELQTVVASRQPSPLGGRFVAMSGASVNRRGDIAFYGTLNGARAAAAIFLVSDGLISPLVLHRDPAPSGGMFDFAAFTPQLTMNDQGDVAFQVVVSRDGQFMQGLFLIRDGEVQKVVLVGDPAPVGGAVSSLFYLALNNQGQVSFWASLTQATTRAALFLWQQGMMRKIVAQNETSPVGGTYLLSGPHSLNDLGHIVFRASLTGAAASAGVFLASPTEVTAVAVAGQRTPVGGLYVDFNTTTDINEAGMVAFTGTVRGGEANEGVFLAQAGERTDMATTNTVLPEGARLTGFLGSETAGSAINDQGDVAFIATVASGQGVFLISNGQTRVLARSGERWPDVGTLVKFGRVGLNNRGNVVMTADPVGGGRGVYVISDGVVRKVAAPGDPAPGGGRFSFADFAAINDEGWVAFRAGLSGTSASEGVFLATADGITTLITNADRPPVGQRFTHFGGVSLNNRGEVSFVALIDEQQGTPRYRGIFIATSQGIRKVMVSGEATPVGGTFVAFADEFSRRPAEFDLEPSDRPALNNQGEVAFYGVARQGSASTAIFIATSEGLQKAVATNENTPVGGQYGSFSGQYVRLNDGGQMLVDVFLRGSPALRGLFLHSGTTSHVVATDQTLSPLGSVFSTFSNHQLNNHGMIVFSATHSQGASFEALYLAARP
jgi:hypothetical protein